MKLVTGANGFIGSSVLSTYGTNALALMRNPSLKHRSVKNELVFDLTKTDRVDDLVMQLQPLGITEMIHTAAITPWSSDPDFSLDRAMTKTLTHVCNALEIPRLTFLSGWIVYDMNSTPPFNEQTPLLPEIAYGKSKLESENYFAKNLSCTTLVNIRLASVYGPGQTSPGLIPNFLKNAFAGKPLVVSALKTRRDYLHIDDLLTTLQLLSETKLAKHTSINIGSGRAVTVEEVAFTVQSIFKEFLSKRVDIAYAHEMKESMPLSNELDVSYAQSLGLLTNPIDIHKGLTQVILQEDNRYERQKK